MGPSRPSRKRDNEAVEPATPPTEIPSSSKSSARACELFVTGTPAKERNLDKNSSSSVNQESADSSRMIEEGVKKFIEPDHTYTRGQQHQVQRTEDENDGFARCQQHPHPLTHAEVEDDAGLRAESDDDVESENESNGCNQYHEGVNKKIYQNTSRKDSWMLQSLSEKAETLIIADSNMRLAKNIRSDMELHVFPGSKLHHVIHILNSAVITSKVKNIVIAVGINDRSSNPYTCSSNLTDIVEICRNFKKSCHFLGVSYGDLPVRERNNIDDLNRAASGLLRTGYIQPLAAQAVKINPDDKRYRIHFDDNTVCKIMHTIYAHFL